MSEILFMVCGIILLYLPCVSSNVMLQGDEDNRNILRGLFTISGMLSVLLGWNDITRMVKETDRLFAILSMSLLVTGCYFLYKKVRMQKSMVSKMTVVFGGLVALVSMALAYWGYLEPCGVCAVFTGILGMLSVPFAEEKEGEGKASR